MFNYIFKFFSFSNISFFFHRRKHCIRSNTFVCCLAAVFIVCAYCPVKLCFAGNEVSELSSSTANFGDGFVDPREVVFIPVLVDGVKTREFVKNSGFELRGGREELLSLHNVDGVLVGRFYSLNRCLSANNTTNPSTNQTADSTDQGCNNSIVHNDTIKRNETGSHLGNETGSHLEC